MTAIGDSGFQVICPRIGLPDCIQRGHAKQVTNTSLRKGCSLAGGEPRVSEPISDQSIDHLQVFRRHSFPRDTCQPHSSYPSEAGSKSRAFCTMFQNVLRLPHQRGPEPGLPTAAVGLHWELPAVRGTEAQRGLHLAVVPLGHGHKHSEEGPGIEAAKLPLRRKLPHPATCPSPITNSGLIMPGGDSGTTEKWVLKGAGPMSEWPGHTG